MKILNRLRALAQRVHQERLLPFKQSIVKMTGGLGYADFYQGLGDIGWFTRKPVHGFRGELLITLWSDGLLPESSDVPSGYRLISGLGLLPEASVAYHHHGKNLIVRDASLLLARLAKDPAEPQAGINMLAVGTGATGPLLGPDAPTINQRKINAEVERKTFSSTVFRDAGGGASAIPTNVVDFTTTFTESEAVGPLNEMGLLSTFDPAVGVQTPNNDPLPPTGYDPAVDVTSLDMMVNYFTFPVLSKPSTMKLTITWRITF